MDYEIKPELQKILAKLKKRDKTAFEQIIKKVKEILNSDPDTYKNLRYDLKRFKRVHIKNAFVLVFLYDKQNHFISFFDYDHHDNVYKKQYGL